MPWFDRNYGDRGLRSRGGGGGTGWGGSGRGNGRDDRHPGGGIMHARAGRMDKDHHQITGRGSRGHMPPVGQHGGVVGNHGKSTPSRGRAPAPSRGKSSPPRGGSSRGGRR